MVETKAPLGNRVQQLVLRLHSQCIGLQLKEVTLRSYITLLLRHLLVLVKSSSVPQRRKRRAQILLSSIILSSLTVLSGVSYGGYQIIIKVLSMYRYSHDRRKIPPLRRTRSQTQLATGARIMYISEKSSLDSNELDKDHRRKKILIPPKDDDVYEHDKFLFKNVELERGKNSQLFYSKFLNQMNVLFRILIPTLWHKNSILLTLQIGFLVMRTWLSLFVAKLDGQIVKDIIAGRGKRFLLDLAIWFLIAIPASYTNLSLIHI